MRFVPESKAPRIMRFTALHGISGSMSDHGLLPHGGGTLLERGSNITRSATAVTNLVIVATHSVDGSSASVHSKAEAKRRSGPTSARERPLQFDLGTSLFG